MKNWEKTSDSEKIPEWEKRLREIREQQIYRLGAVRARFEKNKKPSDGELLKNLETLNPIQQKIFDEIFVRVAAGEKGKKWMEHFWNQNFFDSKEKWETFFEENPSAFEKLKDFFSSRVSSALKLFKK
ncbi:hypothetical protein HN954_00270 [bacterium]|jgi:hypothetical protein|nr:hypothetical protein [bacterium]MBT6832070.1 hypothetical protein [bacterium]MBT6995851.1 hypothetical protein [bacterium]MBT7772338.1 hypothetical protein [bacterium]